MKNATIGLLSILLLFSFYRIIYIENQRYALIVGMCQEQSKPLPDLNCLRDVKTRTHWIWHLYYGLFD